MTGREGFSGVFALSGPHAWRVGLILLVALGFYFRWTGIDERSLSHPEIYIPGVSLSPETVQPPPRHGFLENLAWHFHEEPHPIGYYMAMFAWTSVFGDSAASLRLPGVLFGVGTILLAFQLGAALYGKAAGLAAAALVALHGFHIFWSGMARMYAPGAFFCLLATLVLVRIVSRRDAGFASHIGYVASIFAAIQSTELSWAVFGGHALWAVFYASRGAEADGRGTPTIILLQVAAFILSAPALLHAAYMARGGVALNPSPDFLLHYAAFGFLFEEDEFSFPVRRVADWIVTAAAALSLTFFTLGARRRSSLPVSATRATGGMRPLVIVGAALSLFMAWLAAEAERRGAALAALSLLPLLALLWPAVAGRMIRLLETAALQSIRRLLNLDPFLVLIIGLGALAPLAIFAASLWKPVTVYRAFIVFVPYYLILCGAGLASLWPRRLIFLAAASGTASMLAVSVAHAEARPASPIDYKGLASAIREKKRKDDLVLIRRWNWMDAPITYYLPHDQIIGVDFARRIEERAAPRIWTLNWAEQETTIADRNINSALEGFSPCAKVVARRAMAVLNVRNRAGEACSLAE